MRNEKWIYALSGIIIGLITGWILATNTPPSNRLGMMGRESSIMQSEAIDAHFIEQMIPHHEDAITMAKIAQVKAVHPELKQLADSIIKTQSFENEQMKEWYKQWFDRELPTGSAVMQRHGMMSGSGMHMGMLGNESDITNLENSENFDTAFLQQMIPHHQMAVMMASMLRNGTDRPEMKQLADSIINTQTNEIDKMREWLMLW